MIVILFLCLSNYRINTYTQLYYMFLSFLFFLLYAGTYYRCLMNKKYPNKINYRIN